MLKELAIFQIFALPQTKVIRASNIKSVSLGRKAIIFFLGAVNVILLFTYILGVNTQASTGYEIKALQSQIGSLNQENKKLDLKIAEKASVSNLETQLLQHGFLVVESTKFLSGENQYSQR